MAYSTLSDLKARLGISDSSHDAQLQSILNGAIGIVESITGRNFTGTPVTVTDELHDMDAFTNTRNNFILMLNNADVTELTSLKLNNDVVDSANYSWNSLGRIVLIGSYFDRAHRSYDDYDVVKVTYKHGGSTPAAINEAILQIAASTYNNRVDGVKKESIGRYSYEVGNVAGGEAVPADVLKILKSYRIRRV